MGEYRFYPLSSSGIRFTAVTTLATTFFYKVAYKVAEAACGSAVNGSKVVMRHAGRRLGLDLGVCGNEKKIVAGAGARERAAHTVLYMHLMI